ncbi:amidohydrolase family protein [Citrobacter portucalensis]|nr:amidohydrolase family protein [Citrobacter portucalensis]MBI1681541.1 amidohydrolase family protein [Citrobacter portucalensis]QEH58329.1 amidohydrolase family protein [Citrobacter portucalensis]
MRRCLISTRIRAGGYRCRWYECDADWHCWSLRAGKLADIAVLNQDIMAIPADKLHQTESLLTFVDGQQVYPEP